MSEPCGTCGGSGTVSERVAPTHYLQASFPCHTCRRVVSVEDAEIAAAVREIEREGLCVAAGPDHFHPDETTWLVTGDDGGGLGGDTIRGEGKNLPEAIAAYKKARKP